MRKPWNRGGIRWYLMFLGLVAGRATVGSILCGVPFLAMGIVVHLWAKGCLYQNQEVTTAGPYRFVRHPFYVGNVLLDSAIAIMSGWTLLMCVFPLWWVAIYLPAMRREEAVMTDLFGDVYKTYARHVPMFLPTRRPLPAKGGFSLRNPNILKTEIPRALRFLSYPFLFALVHEIQRNGLLLDLRLTASAFYILLIILFLNALAWQVRQAVTCSDVLSRWFSRTSVSVAFLVAFASVGSLFTYFELEAGWPEIFLGLLLIALSFFFRLRKPQEDLFAALLLLTGASLFWELPWLAVVPVLICSARLLTIRLLPSGSPSPIRRPMLPLIPYGFTGFLVFLIICVLTGIAKEIVTDIL